MIRLMAFFVLLGTAAVAAERRVDLFSDGQVNFQNARFKEAAKSFRTLADSYPDNPDYILWLGRAYDRQADISSPLETRKYTEKARRCFHRVIALDPQNEQAREELRLSHLDDGRHSPSDVFVRIVQLPSDAIGFAWR